MAASEESLRRMVEEREALDTIVADAAREFAATLPDGAAPASQVASLVAACRDKVRKAIRASVRHTFTVFATHYQGVDFPAVAAGVVPGYTEDEMAAIRAETTAPADALAAKILALGPRK